MQNGQDDYPWSGRGQGEVFEAEAVSGGQHCLGKLKNVYRLHHQIISLVEAPALRV
jgi:hypothetical protein